MTIEKINPMVIEQGTKKKGYKASSEGFGSMLDAVGAMGGAAMTAGQMYGGTNSSAVLGAAFSGIGTTSSAIGGGSGGGTPYMAAGAGINYKAGDIAGLGDPTASAIPGQPAGLSQAELINTMNTNSLQLLELQAVMQNNMQGWNTKSNILSADHRARMAMIEKFVAR